VIKLIIFSSILFLSIGSCKKNTVQPLPTPQDETVKPSGIFSSSGSGTTAVLNHTAVRGVLVRAAWKDIEQTEGNFNFTSLDNQINTLKAKGKKFSLAINAGGVGSPDWLITQKNVPYFDYLFRGLPYKLPLIWNDTVTTYLGKLADKLAEKYNNDTSLLLVYIPQMTANGNEGHLNGFSQTAFEAAGYSESKWIDASIKNAKRFALAFNKKALALEVHDLFNSSTPASSIINSLWADNTLNHRVGAAMWWISGKEDYQPNLITVLKNFPGDIYCQVIGRSDETTRFPPEGYQKVFEQAKLIRARYIEPWEYEFGISTWDAVFADFNQYADNLRKY
jgi:hypothetical protein